jgi:threonine synthase
MLKDHGLSQDDEKKGLDEVQKLTDAHIKTIDDLQKKKDSRAARPLMSYFTHLECSVPCGAPVLDPRAVHHLCVCGAPLLARYDLDKARGWSRDSLAGREPNMWRYRELLPLFDGESPVTLGEGFTPLFHARTLGATLGLDRLYIKDESLNPTNSFKARGQSAAITRAKYLGATTIALPTAGNAGNAAAAYSAAAGLACQVFIPKDAKKPFVDECRLYGANVTLVDGLITDAGRDLRGNRRAARLVRRVDAEGAVPHRGQEDDGVRARRADELGVARLDHLSDRRRHRHGRHVESVRGDRAYRLGQPSKAAEDGVGAGRALRADRRAFEQGTDKAAMWENASTIADGLRVPRAIGDFLILRAVRESGGTALAVSDRSMVEGCSRSAGTPGSAPRRKAAPRSSPFSGSSQTGRSSRRIPSCCSTPGAR